MAGAGTSVSVPAVRVFVSVPVPRLEELHQHAAGGLRVYEGDQVARGSGAGDFVDELRAGGPVAVQLGRDVGDAVAQMVHPRPAAGEELRDGRVVAGGGEELQAPLAGAEEHHLDALLLHPLAAVALATGDRFEDGERLVERVHGDSHVVERTAGHSSPRANGSGVERYTWPRKLAPGGRPGFHREKREIQWRTARTWSRSPT